MIGWERKWARRGRALLAVSLLLGAGTVRGQESESYLVLLDYSGSVDDASRARAVKMVAEFLDHRPRTECAVVAFAERIENVLDFGPPERLLMLRPEFVPRARRTVLYDAIFEAGRMLSKRPATRAAILLFTDGRDVGSDLLPQDATQICVDKGIAVHTFGIGSRVNEKILRRLSRLTGGASSLLQHDAEATARLSELNDRLPRMPETATEGGSPDMTPPKSRPSPAPPESRGSAESARALRFLLPGAGILILLAGAALLILRRRRKEGVRCATCGTALDSYFSECPVCRRAAGEAPPPPLPQPELAEAAGGEEPPPLPENEYPSRPSMSDTLDTTVVMLETPVLIVKKGKNLGAVYPVPWCGTLEIGRSRSNNIVVEDRTASARHCRLKHDGDKFFLYDLKSTNGTFLNDLKVSQAFLKDGDSLQVGETHLLFKVQRMSS